MSIQIPFGLHDGELVHIDQIKEKDLHGLACDCVCPHCKAPLQARISKDGKRQAYFAHSSEGCSFQKAYETAIHLFAKKIILQNRKLLFPAILKNEDEIPQIFELKEQYGGLLSEPYTASSAVVIKPEKYVEFDFVEVECCVGDVKPDLIVYSGNNKCFVEIAVTHFIDEDKLEKLKKLNYPVIEIDLSDLQNANLELSDWEHEIIDNPKNRKWIHYPLLAKAIERAVYNYKSEMIDNTTNVEIKNRTEYIELYRGELKRLRNDDMVRQILSSLSFCKDLSNDKLPFFVDIPITGEIFINCDRRIWQSIIFDKFVYNRKTSELIFRNIEWWLKNHNKSFGINWIKHVKKSHIAYSFYNAIKSYLRYLSFLGFIAPIYEVSRKNYYAFESVVWNSRSLNVFLDYKERAAVLSNAIKMVNEENINPDGQIDRVIYRELDIDLYTVTTSNSPEDWLLK